MYGQKDELENFRKYARNSIEELIMEHEGVYRKPYKCTAGKTTIGIGTNLDDRGLSDEAILLLFREEVNQIEGQLRHLLGDDVWESMDGVRRACCYDMVYNLGITGFSKFFNTLNCIRKKEYVQAAGNMRASKWYTQVKNRAERICNMMETGRWVKKTW